MKNYYHTLGLSYEAKPELQLINAAYKALVKLYHPDVYEGDRKSLKRKITEINEAYEVVKRTMSKGESESPTSPPIVPRIPEIDLINVINIKLFSATKLKQ